MLDVTATDAVPWYQGCCKSEHPQRCQGEPMAGSAQPGLVWPSLTSVSSKDDDDLAAGDP